MRIETPAIPTFTFKLIQTEEGMNMLNKRFNQIIDRRDEWVLGIVAIVIPLLTLPALG